MMKLWPTLCSDYKFKQAKILTPASWYKSLHYLYCLKIRKFSYISKQAKGRMKLTVILIFISNIQNSHKRSGNILVMIKFYVPREVTVRWIIDSLLDVHGLTNTWHTESLLNAENRKQKITLDHKLHIMENCQLKTIFNKKILSSNSSEITHNKLTWSIL